MNAQEARKITNKSLKTVAIEPCLNFILNKIKCAALEGRSEVHHPFSGMADYPSAEIQKATFKALRGKGYSVTHHTGDHSDPREIDYETISW